MTDTNERRNCWEALKCGREPGGKNATTGNACPAATDLSSNGVNRGKFAGRFCWTVAGTYCHSDVQGTFARKFHNCLDCSFFKEVEREEGRGFILLPEKK